MPAGLHPSVPPKDGIFITGLRLYNALWDTARGMLMSGASDKQSFQDMPVIWLKPYDISSPSRVPVKHQQYLSPLYCSADHRCHSHAAMVKASTKELSLFINGFDKQGLDEVALLESKPNGMTNQVNFCIQFWGVLCDISGLFLDFNPKFQDIKKKCY